MPSSGRFFRIVSQSPDLRRWTLLAALVLALAGCDSEPEAVEPTLRPVRTVTVEEREAAGAVLLTGTVEAAEGQLTQARNHFQRQQHLMDWGFAALAV